MTLEERIAALESSELARLRVVAQRRLEKLRIERAAVADLRERLELAHANADALASQLAEAKALANVLEPLRATLPTADDTAPNQVVAIAVERIDMLRELVNSERKASMKEFSRLQDELADAKAKLAAANTIIAKLACR